MVVVDWTSTETLLLHSPLPRRTAGGCPGVPTVVMSGAGSQPPSARLPATAQPRPLASALSPAVWGTVILALFLAAARGCE